MWTKGDVHIFNQLNGPKLRGQTVLKMDSRTVCVDVAVIFTGVDVVLPESIRLLLQPFGLSEQAEFDVVYEEYVIYDQYRRAHFVVTGTKSYVDSRDSNTCTIGLAGGMFGWFPA